MTKPSPLMLRLAKAYLLGKPVEPTKAELNCFIDWLTSQANKLPFRFYPCLEDTPLDVSLAHIRSGDPVPVSIIGIEHPHLTPGQNLAFRAVHDWHHLESGADDSFLGELQTYHWATLTAPVGIHWMLYSEIVLQAAANITTNKFQPQKLVRVNPILAGV